MSLSTLEARRQFGEVKAALIEKIANDLGDTLHGSFYAAGVPIQDAMRQAAAIALVTAESHGWGPYEQTSVWAMRGRREGMIPRLDDREPPF